MDEALAAAARNKRAIAGGTIITVVLLLPEAAQAANTYRTQGAGAGNQFVVEHGQNIAVGAALSVPANYVVGQGATYFVVQSQLASGTPLLATGTGVSAGTAGGLVIATFVVFYELGTLTFKYVGSPLEEKSYDLGTQIANFQVAPGTQVSDMVGGVISQAGLTNVLSQFMEWVGFSVPNR